MDLAKVHGKSPTKYDRVLRRVIRVAERLGRAHQEAVCGFIAEVAGVPAAQAQATARLWKTPGWEEVTVELYLRIDDKIFVARELVAYEAWHYLSRNTDEWERFLNSFTRQAVGSLSQTPEQFAYLRRKLFVVTPQDRHDSRLCRASNDSGLNKDLWPRCLHGVVRRAAPAPSIFSYVDSPVPAVPFWSDDRPLGKCACRCHRHPLNQLDPAYHLGGLSAYDDRMFVA